ncbi:RRM_1 domain-containing protein/RRM_2 domain-containing protein, partial [Cephalotus follicularis]
TTTSLLFYLFVIINIVIITKTTPDFSSLARPRISPEIRRFSPVGLYRGVLELVGSRDTIVLIFFFLSCFQCLSFLNFIMPSEMDIKSLSSPSIFNEDVCYPSERQVGFWKTDALPDQYASRKLVASSPLEKLTPVGSQTVNSPEHPELFLMRDQKVNLSLDRQAVGAERAANHSLILSRTVDCDLGTKSCLNIHSASYFAGGTNFNVTGSQYENSLFSSSLSELFTRKLRFSSENALHGHSVDIVASNYEEEETSESLKDIEAQTIGNLLPNDDDLFSGVTDGQDFVVQPSGGDDTEELDFFSSVGGMDLGEDGSSSVQKSSEFPVGVVNSQMGVCNGSVAGEHPCGEYPSRTLFVRNINSTVEDSELRTLFEQYGDIRTLYTACKHRGFVMISYYDIRAARNAMKVLQNKPLRRRKLDIHYSIPKDNPSEKDVNQGTLVVFNLDSPVSNDELRQILGVYGEIKEIRETPHRSHHKFVEFYDVRAAEAALHALNRSDVAGKQIKPGPSCPGGSRRLARQFPSELEQDECGLYMLQSSPPGDSTSGILANSHAAISAADVDKGTTVGVQSIRAAFRETLFHHEISSSVPNCLPSLVRAESVGNQSSFAESGHVQGRLKYNIQCAPTLHPHSLPDYHDGLTSGVQCNSPGPLAANVIHKPTEIIDNRQIPRSNSNGHSIEFNEAVFGSAGAGNCSLPGHHYTWNNSYQPRPLGMMWPNSPSFVNGMYSTHPQQRLHGLPRAPSLIPNTVLPINNHHVGSAPVVNPSLWDRRHAYAGESPDTSGFHPGSLGTMRISNNSLQSLEFVSHNIFSHVGGNFMDLTIPTKSVGLQSHHQRSSTLPGRGQMIHMMNPIDSPNERVRSRRNEGSISLADKKQYELDIDRILRGEDNRTTLMIKNIPNKYTSKMLLAAIDECHRGTYDFIYLPIDFKNKCNVGYAFINMTEPNLIIPFYQAFNGKKWEKFNSEKVASLAYGRIQGKAALVAHFQNSSLMNEDKRCRPILFNTDGPNAGDQLPFPMGVNVRTRSGKARTINHGENHPESLLNLANGEDSFNGYTSSGCAKDSE